MYTKLVNVAAPTSGGGTQDITFTPNGSDPSWTPKVAIAQWNRACTATSTWFEHAAYGIGFTDGTNQRCVCTATEDNAARADTGTISSNNSFITILGASGTVPTVDGVATFNSWLSNGIRINWTNYPGAACYLTILFLGGSDITNVDVGTIMSTTSTGDKSITSLSYQPDFGFFISGTSATENSAVVNTTMSVGAATSSSAQWAQTLFTFDNPVTMDTACVYSHQRVWYRQVASTSIDAYATFTSFNSNGFTITVNDAAAANVPIYYLVMKGGAYAVGNATEPASTGTQQITTNKDTKAVAIFGLDTGTADSAQAGCTWSGGFTDSAPSSYGHVYDDRDNVADSVVVSALDGAGHCYNNITANATANNTTWDDSAIMNSLSSTGFTLYWDNIGQARPFRYIGFGTGVQQFQRSISETAIAVSDSLGRIKSAVRTLSDTATASSTLTPVRTAPLMTQVVRFQKDSSGTNGVTQDVNLSFTPKAIIIYSDGNTADNTASAHYQWIQGFSDGTNHACTSCISDDDETTTDTSSIHRSNAVFTRLSETTNETELAYATCSFGTNKVTFTWTLNDTSATYIHMIAFGGADITNAKVATVQTGRATAGTQDYTGLGFNPADGNSVLFTLSAGYHIQTNSPFTGGANNFGCAASTSKRWCMANIMKDDVTGGSYTRRYHSNYDCFVSLSTSLGYVVERADFNGWITDGFQLNWADKSGYSTTYMSYLVIKGGSWDVGNFQSPTDVVNDVDYTVSVNSKPLRGLMIASISAYAPGNSESYAMMNIGTTDGANQTCISNVDEDNQTTSDSYRINNATKIIKMLYSNGSPIAVANFDSFSTNNFRLDWTTTQAFSYSYGWVVVADPGAQQYNRSISETTIAVIDSIVKAITRIKSISEEAALTEDSIDIARTRSKSISETGASVSDSIVKTIGRVKSISDSASNSDSLAILTGRPLSSSVTVSEVLSRLIPKAISDAITNSDLVGIIRARVKALADTITNSDSITEVEKEAEREISDTVSNSDTLARTVQLSLTATISVLDSITGRVASFIRSLSDTVTNSDSLALKKLYSLADSITNSDSIAIIRDYIRALSDSVTNSDSIVIARTRIKSLSDSVSNSDSIETIKVQIRDVADTITNSDSLAKIRNYIRALSDTVSNSDSLVKQMIVSLADSISNSDSIVRLRIILKSLSDTVSNLDSIEKLRTVPKSLSDTITNSDLLASVVSHIRSLSDSITNSDSIEKLRTVPKSLADTVSNSDSITRTISFARSISDSITNSDIVATIIVKIRSISDTVSNSDSIFAEKITNVYYRYIYDTVTNSDILARMISVHHYLVDTITNSMELIKSKIYNRFIDE